jgi:tetratricopeptide (TPR) repeat protein
LPAEISQPPSDSLFNRLPFVPEGGDGVESETLDVGDAVSDENEPTDNASAVGEVLAETGEDEAGPTLQGIADAPEFPEGPDLSASLESVPAPGDGDGEAVRGFRKRENDEKSGEDENKNEKSGENDDSVAQLAVRLRQPRDPAPARGAIFARKTPRFAAWLRHEAQWMRRSISSTKRRIGFQRSGGRIFTFCIILVIIAGTLFAAVRHARRNSYDVLMVQAQAQYEEKQYQSAFEIYKQASERNNGRVEPVLGMARSAEGLEKFEQAIDIYHSGMELLPFDAASFRAVLLCERGRLYVALKDWESAQENFEAASALDATNFNAWYSLGSVLEERGRLQEALPAYRHARDVSPSAAAAREAVERVSAKLVPPEEDPSVRQTRQYSEAVQVGTVALGLKNYTEASKRFAEALVIRSDDAVAWLGFADARQGLGDLAGAVSSCERVLEKDPNNAAARVKLAGLREKAREGGGKKPPQPNRRPRRAPRSFRENFEDHRRARFRASVQSVQWRMPYSVNFTCFRS